MTRCIFLPPHSVAKRGKWLTRRQPRETKGAMGQRIPPLALRATSPRLRLKASPRQVNLTWHAVALAKAAVNGGGKHIPSYFFAAVASLPCMIAVRS